MQLLKISEAIGSIKSQIDLFICCSSFEERGNLIAKEITTKVSQCKKLIFYNKNEYQVITSNAQRLKEALDPKAHLIDLDTNRPAQNATTINDKLDEIFDREIDTVLFDTTTFTHETLLIIFRLLLYKKDRYKKLLLIYVGAKDYSFNEQNVEKKWLSSGISAIRTIIGYPGVISPARKNHLIILFGFESERTLSLIRELEFDRVSLAFGASDKSIETSHQKINVDRHTALMNLFKNADNFELSLIDPYETKDNIITQINKYPTHNVVISPMNNKLSTIGAGLVAIENPKIQLIYAKPKEYNSTGYSKPKDDCYLVEVS